MTLTLLIYEYIKIAKNYRNCIGLILKPIHCFPINATSQTLHIVSLNCGK